MSKAFTRENDDAPEADLGSRPRRSLLPPGARNYVTADGAAAFREELARLMAQTRAQPMEASPSTMAMRLESVEPRIRELRRILQTAVIPPAPQPGEDRVRFGAWVRVRSEGGSTTVYRIVGVDETNPDRGWVSWVSPLARALIKSRSGDVVRLLTPDGEERLEILSVDYGPAIPGFDAGVVPSA